MSRKIRNLAVLLAASATLSIGFTVPASADATIGLAFLGYDGNDESENLSNASGCHEFVGDNLLSTLGARSAIVLSSQPNDVRFWSNRDCTGVNVTVPNDDNVYNMADLAGMETMSVYSYQAV